MSASIKKRDRSKTPEDVDSETDTSEMTFITKRKRIETPITDEQARKHWHQGPKFKNLKFHPNGLLNVTDPPPAHLEVMQRNTTTSPLLSKLPAETKLLPYSAPTIPFISSTVNLPDFMTSDWLTPTLRTPGARYAQRNAVHSITVDLRGVQEMLVVRRRHNDTSSEQRRAKQPFSYVFPNLARIFVPAECARYVWFMYQVEKPGIVILSQDGVPYGREEPPETEEKAETKEFLEGGADDGETFMTLGIIYSKAPMMTTLKWERAAYLHSIGQRWTQYPLFHGVF